MWYDATSAVSVLEDPKTYPDLVGKIGYLPAPIAEKPNSGWLYTWSLGIPKAAKNPDGAWKFISWMTSKDYMKLVGEKLGWARVPPGSRTSTYTELPEYEAISKSYGPLTLKSITERDPEQAHGATGSVHGRAVRRDSRVPGSRDAGESADQRGDRRTEVGGRRAGTSTEIRRGRRQDIPGEVMTLTAETEADASQKAVAERVRKIREAQDTGVSRAEGWRRRGPLLPALIFMIVVTQIPFLFTLYYSTLSWNLVRPGSRQFVGLNNYIAVVKDSQFWRVALNTVILIVVVVLVSAFLGLLLALLLDRAFLGRGVVRTLLITPFLVTPVAAALIWKTTILDPTNGILNWVLSLVGIGKVDWIGQFPLTMVMIDADLAVDAVHDVADPRRPPVDASRHPGGRSSRRCGRVSTLPRVDAAPPSALHRTGRRARRDLSGQHVRRHLHDDPGRAGYREREPAVLHLPARVPRLRHGPGRGDGRGRGDLHDDHRDTSRCG